MFWVEGSSDLGMLGRGFSSFYLSRLFSLKAKWCLFKAKITTRVFERIDNIYLVPNVYRDHRQGWVWREGVKNQVLHWL